jgi:hypothetical protein
LGSDQLTDDKLVGPSAVGVAGGVARENDEVDVGVGSCGVAGAGADQQRTSDVVSVGRPACDAADDVLDSAARSGEITAESRAGGSVWWDIGIPWFVRRLTSAA